jgi:transposase
MLVQVKNNTLTRDIASSFGISSSCVYSWIKKFSEINFDPEKVGLLLGKRGPKFKNIDERISKLANIISEDCSFTQLGMSRKLANENIHISQSTVCLALKKMEMTRKRLVLISDKKNDPDTIASRHLFAVNYRRYIDSDLLYIDETGFNLHTKRSYGYSPINVPARMTVKANRGRNVTLLALISVNGVLGFKIIDGACNSVKLEEFLSECINNSIFRPNNVLLMDNVNFHKSSNVRTILRQNNINHDYLPVYSPELNPIEEVFSMLKNSYYRLAAPQSFEDIKRNIEVVLDNWFRNSMRFDGFYSHMREYLGKGFIRENF